MTHLEDDIQEALNELDFYEFDTYHFMIGVLEWQQVYDLLEFHYYETSDNDKDDLSKILEMLDELYLVTF